MSRERKPGHNERNLLMGLRIYLDVCDVLNARKTSMTPVDLATNLRERYQATMWPKDKDGKAREPGTEEEEDTLEGAWKKHFGLGRHSTKGAKSLAFPDDTVLQGYLKLVCDHFKGYFSEQKKGILVETLKRDKKTYYELPRDTEAVKKFRSIALGLLRQLPALADEKPTLVLAMSDSVNYFLTRIADTIPSEALLRTLRYSAHDVFDQLWDRSIDLALGWHEGYQSAPQAIPANINGRELPDAACQVCVLFHPALKLSDKSDPLGKKAHDHKKPKTDSGVTPQPGTPAQPAPTEVDRSVFLNVPGESLAGSKLFYPDLPQVARIGEALAEEYRIKGVQLDSFAAVVSAVREKHGLGLFFGLDWLLKELTRQHRIMSAPLNLTADLKKYDLRPDMKLYAFTREEDPADVTGQASDEADDLVRNLKTMLAERRAQPAGWEVVGNVTIEPAAFADGHPWYIWFVTPGTDPDVISPRWVRGEIRFDPPGDGGHAPEVRPENRPQGKLFLPKVFGEIAFMDVWVAPPLSGNGFLVLRFQLTPGTHQKKAEELALSDRTIAYFPTKIRRGDSARAGDEAYFGTLNFSRANKPHASPIILSRLSHDELGVKNCQSIARSYLSELFYGDEAGSDEAGV